MAQGMFGITPQLEAQGRKGDTEVGRISKGSIVLPVVITQDPDGQELMSAMQELYEALKLDYNSFTVTAENTEYATDQDPIEAHLTVGEFIIPALVLNTAPELKDALKTMFDELGVNINQYTVGHKDNSINPETGLPEFGWLKKAWKKVTKTVKKVVQPVVNVVKTVVKSVADLGKDFVTGLKGGIPGIVNFADKAVQNPLVQAAVSFVNPLAGSLVNAYAKLDSGQTLSAADLAAIGVSSYDQLANIKIADSTKKAIDVGSKLVSGEDPLKVLASNYGTDFAKTLGLDTKVNTALTDTFGADTANYITQNFDVNKAAADLVGGKSAQDLVMNQFGTDVVTYAGNQALAGIGATFGTDTENFLRDRMDLNLAAENIIAGVDPARIVANQFGDDVVNYLAGDDQNMQALGYAGIESSVAMAGGADAQTALTAGAKEYYDRGGQLPDVGTIGQLAGIDTTGFDWNLALPDLNIQTPEILAQGYDWLKNQNIDFGNFDFGGFNAPDINMDFGQFADLGGNLGDLNWEGVDWQGTGYSLGELADMGVDLGSLNMGNLTLPQALGLAGVAGQIAQEGVPEEDIVASLENPLLKPKDEGPLFSRQILESTPIV